MTTFQHNQYFFLTNLPQQINLISRGKQLATNHQLFAKLKGFNLFHLNGQSIYVNILGNNAEEYWRMGDGFLPNTGNGSFYGNMNGEGVGNSVMYGEKLLYFLLSLESGLE